MFIRPQRAFSELMRNPLRRAITSDVKDANGNLLRRDAFNIVKIQ